MALNPNPKPPYNFDFTRDQAAAFLGIRPATLADLACRGEGPPFVVVGSRAWYRRADCERWLESRMRGPVRIGATR